MRLEWGTRAEERRERNTKTNSGRRRLEWVRPETGTDMVFGALARKHLMGRKTAHIPGGEKVSRTVA